MFCLVFFDFIRIFFVAFDFINFFVIFFLKCESILYRGRAHKFQLKQIVTMCYEYKLLSQRKPMSYAKVRT